MYGCTVKQVVQKNIKACKIWKNRLLFMKKKNLAELPIIV